MPVAVTDSARLALLLPRWPAAGRRRSRPTFSRRRDLARRPGGPGHRPRGRPLPGLAPAGLPARGRRPRAPPSSPRSGWPSRRAWLARSRRRAPRRRRSRRAASSSFSSRRTSRAAACAVSSAPSARPRSSSPRSRRATAWPCSPTTRTCAFTSTSPPDLDAVAPHPRRVGPPPLARARSPPSDPPSLAAHLDRQEARDAASPEQALLALGRALLPIPGAKTVLLFGYGLGRLEGGTVQLDSALRRGPRRPRPRRAPPSSAWTSPKPSGTPSRSGLRQVAEDTGGQYFKVHENAGAALSRVAAALAGHYVLAFERPEGRAGRAPRAPLPGPAPRHRPHPHPLCGLTPSPDRRRHADPAPLLAASLSVAFLGAIAHPVWGQSRDGRDWSRETARAVPDWVRDAVVYEVFPRAFSPEGNLAGVTARLDHVRDLGATVVWLMPIHPIGVEKRKGTYGSPYSIRDFHAVNPDYGTAEDLKRLVREAHARGLKVILDVVANHTSWDSVMMATPGALRPRRAGARAAAERRLVGRREARLREPEDPRVHDRHDVGLAARLRRRRLPLRRGRPRPHRLLGGGPAEARGDSPGPLPARRVEHARPHGEGLRRRLRAGPSTPRSTASFRSAPRPPASAPPGRRSGATSRGARSTCASPTTTTRRGPSPASASRPPSPPRRWSSRWTASRSSTTAWRSATPASRAAPP